MEHLLDPKPLGLMLEYTSRCNLRCKYCTKNNPGDSEIPGRDMDMTERTLDAVLKNIQRYKFKEILLAGTGESTFNSNWIDDFPKIIQFSKAANPAAYCSLNTNLALKYDKKSFSVLAQLDHIIVSIDTSDASLTREVRSKSDLGLILFNLISFNAYCKSNEIKLPRITINITLYQIATKDLPELITMLSSLPVSEVTLSDMVETEGAKSCGLRAINADNTDEFREAIQSIRQALDRAKNAPFKLLVQPYFLERLNTLIQQQTSPLQFGKKIQVNNHTDSKTKLCLQPWTRFTFAANGAIFPCCVTNMVPVGQLVVNSNSGLDEDNGINGSSIRSFRKNLLQGKLPAVCNDCTNAKACNTEELIAAVEQLLN